MLTARQNKPGPTRNPERSEGPTEGSRPTDGMGAIEGPAAVAGELVASLSHQVGMTRDRAAVVASVDLMSVPLAPVDPAVGPSLRSGFWANRFPMLTARLNKLGPHGRPLVTLAIPGRPAADRDRSSDRTSPYPFFRRVLTNI